MNGYALTTSLIGGGLLGTIVTNLFSQKKRDEEVKNLAAMRDKLVAEKEKILLENNITEAKEIRLEHNVDGKPGDCNDLNALEASVLYFMFQQLERGRIKEVVQWCNEVEERVFFVGTLEVALELALVRSSLSRLCGNAKSFSYLSKFGATSAQYSYAQYEKALLHFAKSIDKKTIFAYYSANTNKSIELRKMWLSLLALISLHKNDIIDATNYFDAIKTDLDNDGYFDAYASLQIGIAAAGLGYADYAKTYLFEVAKTINGSKKYPVKGYPYTSLIAEHNRAFVLTIIGINPKIKKGNITLLSGHSHLLAQYSKILRSSDRALETIVDISQSWGNIRLETNSLKKRLKDFETLLLSNAGTIFITPA